MSASIHESERAHDSVSRVLRWALLAAGVAAVACALFVSVQRTLYPYEIEWIEGSSVDHVVRILRGQKLYVEPSSEFIPQLYTPLYFYVSAAVAKLTGIGFLPLRLVSLAAALCAGAFLFAIVRRECANPAAGFVAASFFAATYAASGTWFEVAHSDSLMLACFLGAVWLARREPKTGAAVAAGVLLALAFFSKQTAAVLAAALLAGSLLTRPRWAVVAGAVAATTVGVAWFALDALHDGWLAFYAWKLPKGHAFETKMWVEFWTVDMLQAVPIALLASVAVVLARPGQRHADRLFWATLLAGSLAAAWLGRLHSGGFANVLMPIHAALALLVGLAWHHFGGDSGVWARRVTATLLLAQFALLAYDPRAALPSAEDRAAGEQLMERLRAVGGDVYIPFHGYYASMTGHPMHAHMMAINDVKRADAELGAQVEAELQARIRGKEFAALVLDRFVFRGLVQQNYAEMEPPIDGEDVFIPVVGVKARPKYFMEPK